MCLGVPGQLLSIEQDPLGMNMGEVSFAGIKKKVCLAYTPEAEVVRHHFEALKNRKFAEIAGYSSPEEFITHALEKELAKLEDADSEEEIKKRLADLGYI